MKRVIIAAACALLAICIPLTGLGETKILYAGSDIELGDYSIVCNKTDVVLCTVAVFGSKKDYMQYSSPSVTAGLKENADYYRYLKKGEECSVSIRQNQVLMIDGGKATITLEAAYTEPTTEEKKTEEVAAATLDAVLHDPYRSSGEKLMARLNYYIALGESTDQAADILKYDMIGQGYSADAVTEMLAKAQAGEEIHDFARVNYDEYNMPAEENGFKWKTIMAEGTIKEYLADGNKKTCSYGIILEQADGNQWLIYCAEKANGKILGKLRNSDPAQHVFEGYENQEVAIYGQYLGFSEKYKLPVIDIFDYGGMFAMEENTWIQTSLAERNMSFSYSYFGEEILGATDTITSEPW